MPIHIKQILKEQWEDFLFQHQNLIPEYVNNTIHKMLSCRDPEKLGYHKYACPDHPDNFRIIPNTCKSNFCNSCGKILTDKFVSKVESNFPLTSFHHICFTIPDSLRILLSKNRFLLNCLFKAASETILSFSKEKHFLPLIIAALHSFGRDLKFHPHIHLLVSSGGLLLKDNSTSNKWKNCSFFPFKMLHLRYKFLLVSFFKHSISSHLQSNKVNSELSVFSDSSVLNAFFNPLLNINWYVHDSTEIPSDKFSVSYIVRYTKRPPISESRIIHYGKLPHLHPEKIWVIFSFKQRNQPEVKWTLPVDSFISRLIVHILPPFFKQVRYYGVLSNRVRGKLLKVTFNLLQKQKQIKKFLSWRERVFNSTGSDPLVCSMCKKLMKLVEIAYYSPKLDSLKVYCPP